VCNTSLFLSPKGLQEVVLDIINIIFDRHRQHFRSRKETFSNVGLGPIMEDAAPATERLQRADNIQHSPQGFKLSHSCTIYPGRTDLTFWVK